MDLKAAFLWRVVGPLSPSLLAKWLWEQGRREGLRELLIVDELVSPGDVAVDVGANFGLFARRLARLVGQSGRVYVFEPHPKQKARLWRLGELPHVTYLPMALSDYTGTGGLKIPQFDGSAVDSMATLEKGVAPGEEFDNKFEVVNVQVQTLERALACETRRIGFVKCDIEGHELAFLRGALGRLTRDHAVLLLEIEQRHQKRNISETFSLLDNAGYDGWVLRADGLAPYDTFDVERDQLAILRSRRGATDLGADYLNTFLFTSRHRPLPPAVEAMQVVDASYTDRRRSA